MESGFFPLAATLHRYDRSSFRGDLFAGVTVALVAIPQAMAYAMIAQVPPVYGLYAYIVSSIVCALFNSSPYVSAGPANAISILVASRLSEGPAGVDPNTMLFTLTFLVGAIQLGLGLVRAGALVNFISNAVIAAYMAGAGLLIVANQFPNLLGVSGPKAPGFLDTFRRVAEQAGLIRPESLALGLATLALALGLARFAPRLPGMLLSIIAATAAASLLGFTAAGPDGKAAVKVVGDIGGGIPQGLPALTAPSFEPGLLRDLFGGALAIAILSLAQTVSIARAFAARTGRPISPDREFVGIGLANAAASFFQGLPGSGSLVRSAVVFRSGGRTKIANIVGGVLTAALVLPLAPLANRIPVPALAGVIAGIGLSMVNPGYFLKILRSTPTDILGYLATFACALAFPAHLETAIFVGVVFSFLVFIRQASTLHAAEMIGAPRGQFREIADGKEAGCPAISLLRLDGSLFFGIASELGDRLRGLAASRPLRVIILLMRRAQHIDMTTLEVIREFARTFRAQGGTLFLCGILPELKAMMDRLGLTAEIGPENIFPAKEATFASAQDAIRRARTLLPPGSCPCHGQFFAECPPPPVVEM